MHIADLAPGHPGANAIVGGGISHVVGAGIASKRLKNDSIAVAFFGDGAMQQGIFYESMNMAGLWDLPVLFVCINNQYGMGTRIDHATRSTNFGLRAEALGLAADAADGQNVEEVMQKAQALVDGARQGKPGVPFRFVFPLLRARAHGQEPLSHRRGGRGGAKAGSGGVGAHGSSRERKLATQEQLDEMDAAISREMERRDRFHRNLAGAASSARCFATCLRRESRSRSRCGLGFTASSPQPERRKWSRPRIATRSARRSTKPWRPTRRSSSWARKSAPTAPTYGVTKDLIETVRARPPLDTPISEAGLFGAGVGAAMTGPRPVVDMIFVDFIS